jgi:hypothetical protein
MSGSIVWSGIPVEFSKSFKNVEYEEDPISLFELEQLDRELDEFDRYDWDDGDLEDEEIDEPLDD